MSRRLVAALALIALAALAGAAATGFFGGSREAARDTAPATVQSPATQSPTAQPQGFGPPGAQSRAAAPPAVGPRGTEAPASERRTSQPVPVPAPDVESARSAHRGGFRSEARLREHYEKHGREFGSVTQAEYLALARELRDRPPGPRVLEAARADGVVTRFDRDSGAFLAVDRDGTIRTFFKPRDGEAYFRRQLHRASDDRR